MSPGSSATAARSRPTAASISASAAARSGRLGAVVGLARPGLAGVGQLVERHQRQRAAGQQRRRARRRSAGRSSARVISHPAGRRRRGSRPARHRGAADRGAQRAGLGAEPGGALVVGGARDGGGRVGRARPCAARSCRPQWDSVVSSAGSGSPSAPPGVGRRRGGVVGQGHGRQRHRGQALVGPGHARAVAGAEGRPAVEQAGRRAGGAHRHRADRGLPGQVPQLRAWPPDRRRPR